MLDLLAVVTVVPLLAAVVLTARAAIRGYHPRRRPLRQTPATFGLSAEPVRVPGDGGVSLACWFIPAPGPSPAVVVLGHGSGRDSGMLMPLAKGLHEAGYHVLTFDLRDHGESDGDRRLRGHSTPYLNDHHNVVRYLKERGDLGDFGVVCLGLSMSAWTSAAVAGLEPDLVRAAVCDGSPTRDVSGTMGRLFDATSEMRPGFTRGPIMSAILRKTFVSVSMYCLQPTPWPKDIGSARLLVIGGEADPVARPQDLQALADWYPEAEFLFIPGAGHMQGYEVAPDKYLNRVVELIEEVFPAGGA